VSRREITVEGLAAPISHYADAVVAGDTLYVSGIVPADVVKVTVYLTDVDDRPRINPVRQEFFGTARPASTLVEVSRLAVPGARLEIEAVAHLGS
jgi:2-iminobutanoate/2-iminopropanoate deaminase